jgi:hypothetical protein
MRSIQRRILQQTRHFRRPVRPFSAQWFPFAKFALMNDFHHSLQRHLGVT